MAEYLPNNSESTQGPATAHLKAKIVFLAETNDYSPPCKEVCNWSEFIQFLISYQLPTITNDCPVSGKPMKLELLKKIVPQGNNSALKIRIVTIATTSASALPITSEEIPGAIGDASAIPIASPQQIELSQLDDINMAIPLESSKDISELASEMTRLEKLHAETANSIEVRSFVL